MLVYKDGNDKKDILGFRCDLCDHATMTDVIPNKHGEFRYICPKCGHHMKEMTETETKEEETVMTNAYTVANAAKRLNCSTSTIVRAIYDGRFHDCFTEAGYAGRPTWMIPSDQVEEWVTKGGFLQSKSSKKHPGILTRKAVKEGLEKARAEITSMPANAIQNQDELNKMAFDTFKKNQEKKPRMVFDPEVGKEVEVLNLFKDAEEEKKPELNEFEKRVVRRVAKKKDEPEKKYVKVLDRQADETIVKRDANGKPIGTAVGGDTDGDEALVLPNSDILEQVTKHTVLANFANSNQPAPHIEPIKVAPENPVVRTYGGFSITIPTDMIEDMVYKQLKNKLTEAVGQMQVALALANETLKKLKEAIA